MKHCSQTVLAYTTGLVFKYSHYPAPHIIDYLCPVNLGPGCLLCDPFMAMVMSSKYSLTFGERVALNVIEMRFNARYCMDTQSAMPCLAMYTHMWVIIMTTTLISLHST